MVKKADKVRALRNAIAYCSIGTELGRRTMLWLLDQSRELTRPVGAEISCSEEEMDGISDTFNLMTSCLVGNLPLLMECLGFPFLFQSGTSMVETNPIKVFLLRVKNLCRGPWVKRVEMLPVTLDQIKAVKPVLPPPKASSKSRRRKPKPLSASARL